MGEMPQQSRKDRALERDAAVKRILHKHTCSLATAVGLRHGRAGHADVAARSRKLLRLLHPDFVINLPLKGTPQHARIEAAFKKLNGLRDVG